MEHNTQTKQSLEEALIFGKETQAELAIAEITIEEAIAAQPGLIDSVKYPRISELLKEITASQKVFNSHMNEVIRKTEERIENYEQLLLAGEEGRRGNYFDLESEIMKQEEELDAQVLKTRVFVEKIADLRTKLNEEITRLEVSE